MDQESRDVHPFQIYGNVWYVGDSWVCVHLIDTGEGLLLIDSGSCGATAMLVNAIWEAGFNPADVKWIIHSHGHVDHFGGANFFKKMFGTKLYLGEPDARMFHERPEIAVIQESRNDADYLFQPDYEIREGDVLTFGNTTITFYLVPGHTDGCIACFFDAYDGDQVKRCGYYGGFGFNTLQKDYLIEIGDTAYNTRKVYLESLAKVRTRRWTSSWETTASTTRPWNGIGGSWTIRRAPTPLLTKASGAGIWTRSGMNCWPSWQTLTITENNTCERSRTRWKR